MGREMEMKTQVEKRRFSILIDDGMEVFYPRLSGCIDEYRICKVLWGSLLRFSGLLGSKTYLRA